MNSQWISSITWGGKTSSPPHALFPTLAAAALAIAILPSLARPAHAQTATPVYGSDTQDIGYARPTPRLGPPVNAGSYSTEAHYDSRGDLIYLGSVGAKEGNEDPNFSYGSAYDPNPVDISQGFVTRALVDANDSDGFAFVVHNPDNTTDSLRDPGSGAYLLPRSLSVQFVHLGPLTGDYGHNHNNTTFRIFVAAVNAQGQNNVLGQVDSTTLSDDDQILQIRYLPKFQTVDVYATATNGGTKLLIRVPNVNLKHYGITQPDANPSSTAVYGALGWTAATPRIYSTGRSSFSNSLPAWLVQWSIGNSLVFASGFGPNYYEDRFPFATTGQNVWNGHSKDLYDLRAAYEITPPAKSSSTGTSNDVFSFTVGGYEKNVDIGVGADLIATGGEATINYPLLLDMALPAQYSANPGQSFTVPISFTPDPAATLTTTTPTANVTADLTFGLDVGVNLDASVLGHSLTSGNLIDLNIPTKHVKFFDLQEILQSGLVPFVNGGVNYAGSFQGDGENTSGEKKTGGSTEGAKDGASPADFVSFGITIPDLSTSGTVDSNGTGSADITSSADSPFVSLSSDFTNAVLGEIPGLDILTLLPFFNSDYSLNLGGTNVELGFHLADLYGSLDLGTHVDYDFTPNPQVYLHLSDPNDASKTAVLGPFPLDPTTHTVLSPPTVNLPANGDPLTITPEVTLTGPNTPNSFTTNGQLNIGGSLDFNPFEFSFAFGSISFNSSSALGLPFPYSLTGSFPVGTLKKTFEIGTQSASNGGNSDAVPFQSSIYGKPFTLFPVASDNPVLDALSPSSALMQASGATGSLPLTLTTEHAYLNGEVVWDYDGVVTDPQPSLLPYNRQSMSQVLSSIPLSLLTAPSVHTITLINTDGTGNLYPSNSVSFTVNAPAPTLANVAASLNGHAYTPIANGGGFQITLTGSNFLPPHTGTGGKTDYAGSVAQWNGQKLTTTYVDAQHLTASVPATLVTTTNAAQITVLTAGPGGGQSSAVALTPVNPAPVLASLSQTQSIPGASGLTLDLIGTGFLPGSTVQWTNGTQSVNKSAGYISPSHLTLALTASDLSQPGTRTLRVQNPAPGGGQSGPQTFTVGQYPAGGGAVLAPTLTRQSDGIHVRLTLTNTSQTAADDSTIVLSVTATPSGSSTALYPAKPSPLYAVPVGTIPAGQSVTLQDPKHSGQVMEYVFPLTLGAKGQAVQLTISGSTANKQFTSRLRATLP